MPRKRKNNDATLNFGTSLGLTKTQAERVLDWKVLPSNALPSVEALARKIASKVSLAIAEELTSLKLKSYLIQAQKPPPHTNCQWCEKTATHLINQIALCQNCATNACKLMTVAEENAKPNTGMRI